MSGSNFGFDEVTVDTSTLRWLHLWSEDLLDRPGVADRSAGAIEALVLFDRVVLDGPSVDRDPFGLAWVSDLDDPGVLIRPASVSDEAALYQRGAEMFQRIAWSRELLLAAPAGDALTEVVEYVPVTFPHLRDLLNTVPSPIRVALADAFAGPLAILDAESDYDGIHPRANELVASLVRLFYYLALQEVTGSLLLLHPSKSAGLPAVDPGPVGYHFAAQVFREFDRQVRAGYEQRQQEWLGRAPRSLPAPPLAAFVLGEAQRRGWSVGRTIGWLRQQPEVHRFRRGMRELDELVTAGDKAGVDAVLHDLQEAADRWSAQIGVDVRPRSRFSLQAALPLVQPAAEFSIPRPPRGPGGRMLGLMTWVTLGA